jgi:hypothetical protein
MKFIKSIATVSLALFLFSCSKVTSVSMETRPEYAIKGKTIQLKAKLTGEGKPDTTINWTILDKVSSGTSISKTGLLSVAENETAYTLKVKAAALQDTAKFDTLTIKLSLNPELFYGTWNKNNGNYAKLTKEAWNQYYTDGNFYNVVDLKWFPIINDDIATKDDFPEGYLCFGIVGKAYNIKDTYSGKAMKNKIFMNKERTKIYRIIDNNPNGVFWTKK